MLAVGIDAATKSDSVRRRRMAISFNPFQKASSKLMLVLCPARTIERLTTGDFISLAPFLMLRCRHKRQSRIGIIIVEGAATRQRTRGLREWLETAGRREQYGPYWARSYGNYGAVSSVTAKFMSAA